MGGSTIKPNSAILIYVHTAAVVGWSQ